MSQITNLCKMMYPLCPLLNFSHSDALILKLMKIEPLLFGDLLLYHPFEPPQLPSEIFLLSFPYVKSPPYVDSIILEVDSDRLIHSL
jgi:hypothetical protein